MFYAFDVEYAYFVLHALQIASITYLCRRGALIKPWIFKEYAEGSGWEPTLMERVEVYHRF
jgi:hypothetical protein